MALKDNEKEYILRKKERNIVICIYPKSIRETDQSPVNDVLEHLQLSQMKEAREKELEIQAAFVFGNKVVYARNFQKLEKSLFYMDYVSESARLSHIWFMGMALLERKINNDCAKGILSENYLYLLTDRAFERVETAKIMSALRFRDLPVTPVLIKSKDAGGGKLEAYIDSKGKVWQDSEFCRIV